MTAALEGGEWSAARPGRTLPPGKTRYPFYRRLGGPQGRSGRAENLVPTGIWSRTVQPVVSRYTDWATLPTIYIYINIYYLNKKRHPFINKTSQCSVKPTKPDKLSIEVSLVATCWLQCMYSSPSAGEKHFRHCTLFHCVNITKYVPSKYAWKAFKLVGI